MKASKGKIFSTFIIVKETLAPLFTKNDFFPLKKTNGFACE